MIRRRDRTKNFNKDFYKKRRITKGLKRVYGRIRNKDGVHVNKDSQVILTRQIRVSNEWIW